MLGRNQIGSRLLRLTLAGYFASALVLFVVEIFFEHRGNTMDFERSLLAYENTFRDPLSKAVFNLDDTQVQSIIDGILKSPSIRGVRIRGEGRVLYEGWEPKEVNTKLPTISFDLPFPVPIPKMQGKILAQTTIYYSTHTIFQSTISATIRFLIFLAINSLVLALILYIFTKKILAIPLSNLANSVKDISLEAITNRPTIVERGSKRSDEFGVLEESFNTMIRHIQVEHKEMQVAKTNLANLNKNLEHEVLLRTEQLKREVAKSVNNSKVVALSEMAGGVAHEVNNPLAIIIGRLTQLQRLYDRKTLSHDQAQHIFQSLRQGVDRIKQIIDRLRVITSIDPKINLEPIEVAEILWQATETANALFGRKGIKISLVQKARCFVLTKPHELIQIITSLVENSVEAMGNQPDRWIKIICQETGEKVTIQIVDNGPGIPPDIQDKVFQPFFTTKQVGDGPGIGLSIAKSILQSHGGKIYFDFAQPHTTICLELKKST